VGVDGVLPMSEQQSETPIIGTKATEDPTLYFPVSLLKLVVMSICTVGIYELYWYYKNWCLIKEREKLKIMPFWRAFFAYFFCYSLFKRIDATARSQKVQKSIAPGPLAAGWTITTLMMKLPGAYCLVTYLAVLFLLPVQSLVNEINRVACPNHSPNSKFTGWNVPVVVVGAASFALILISFLGLERAADISSPASYAKQDIRFSYPRNWEVTEDVQREGYRYLFVESPGAAMFIAQIYSKQDAVPLSKFAERFSAQARQDIPVANIGRSSFSAIEKATVSGRKKGIREGLSLTLLGMQVPHTREYYLIDANDKIAYLISQTATEDLSKVQPGFNLIFRSFVVE
jgi:hypothetical protein